MADIKKSKKQILAEINTLKAQLAEIEAGEIKNQADQKKTSSGNESKTLIQDFAQYTYSVICNENGKVISTYHSPQCFEVTGYSSEEYQTNPNLWIEMVYYQDKEEVSRFFDELIKQDQHSGTIEHRIIHKDGSIHWIANSCTLQKNQYGKIIREDGFIIDITHRKQGEEAIRRLASIVESSEDAIISETLDGIIISWNQGAEYLYGFAAKEAVGQKNTLIAPDDSYVREVEDILINIRNGKRIKHLETLRKTKSGVIVDVSLTVSPIKDYKGKIVGLSMIARDITLEKQMEKALISSEDKYRSIINLTSEGYWMADAKTLKVIEVNESLCKMLGYRRNEVLTRLLYDFVDDVNIKIMREQAEKIYNTPHRNYHIVLKTKSGQDVFAWVNATTFLNKAGKPAYTFAFITDISELKKAEEALKESEARLQAFLASSPDIVLILDDAFTILEIYTARKDLLWASKLELIGKKIDHKIPETVSVSLLKELANIKKTKKSVAQIEFKLDMKGKEYHFSALASKIISANKSSKEKIIVVIRDQTEQKRIERLKKDVELIVRHDLKGPLSAIMGFTQLLRNDTINEKQQEWISFIESSANQMLNQINHSLDIFRIEEGSFELRPYEFELLCLFQKLIKDYMSVSKVRNIDIAFLLHNKVVSVVETSYIITGEELLLESLFANLLKNALEASPVNSKITISIEDTKDYHQINIHNSGVIPDKIRQSFFEKYSSSGKKEGTGLGTYTALLIAKAHQGTITFNSSNEKGTHLLVSLPKKLTISSC